MQASVSQSHAQEPDGAAERRDETNGVIQNEKSSENMSGVAGKKPSIISSIRLVGSE